MRLCQSPRAETPPRSAVPSRKSVDALKAVPPSISRGQRTVIRSRTAVYPFFRRVQGEDEFPHALKSDMGTWLKKLESQLTVTTQRMRMFVRRTAINFIIGMLILEDLPLWPLGSSKPLSKRSKRDSPNPDRKSSVSLFIPATTFPHSSSDVQQPMIPTFVFGWPTGKETGPYLAVDLGQLVVLSSLRSTHSECVLKEERIYESVTSNSKGTANSKSPRPSTD